LAAFCQAFERSGNRKRQLFEMLAFLLRYGPKSIDEILNKPVSFNVELADAIASIMEEEKAKFDANLMTGDS
jgi:hypothetical protein